MYNYIKILEKYIVINNNELCIKKSDLNNLDLKIAMHILLNEVSHDQLIQIFINRR